jgi:hypothetical protein
MKLLIVQFSPASSSFSLFYIQKFSTLMQVLNWLNTFRFCGAGYVTWMGTRRNVNQTLVGKPESKKPLASIIFKSILREMGYRDLN